MRVFIVDHSALVLERLAIALAEFSGIEIVGQATNPRDAIKGINDSGPDVVIADIAMRGMSGIDLLKKIKTSSPVTKVIALCDYPYPQYRQKYTEAGADYFLDKSREFERIKVILEKLKRHSVSRIVEIMGGRLPII